MTDTSMTVTSIVACVLSNFGADNITDGSILAVIDDTVEEK